jgi:NAD(P)-dependent dehydrogenase (short-subunit alcohol dehydrogenase family)
MSLDLLGYKGKVVAITGAATGMGRETTELLLALGAEVHAMDIAPIDLPVAQALRVDLSDPASIDAAVAQLPKQVDRLFGCAGISAMYLGKTFSPLHVVLVNFVGPRHLVESIVPRMPQDGAIALIASMSGSAWRDKLAKTDELLATPDFASAKKWLEDHVDDPEVLGGDPRLNMNYRFSKEALVTYMKRQTWPLAEKHIRINTLSPGLTVTPMMASFDAIAGTGDPDLKVIWPAVGRPSNPKEQAEALLFLNSDMARYVSGVDLLSDYGYRVREQLGLPPAIAEIGKQLQDA